MNNTNKVRVFYDALEGRKFLQFYDMAVCCWPLNITCKTQRVVRGARGYMGRSGKTGARKKATAVMVTREIAKKSRPQTVWSYCMYIGAQPRQSGVKRTIFDKCIKSDGRCQTLVPGQNCDFMAPTPRGAKLDTNPLAISSAIGSV